MDSLFKSHPASVGETYLEHMRAAFSFAGPMFVGAFACFVHGLLPFLFTSTGSGIIRRLHDRMVVNRVRHAAPTPAPSEPAHGMAAGR